MESLVYRGLLVKSTNRRSGVILASLLHDLFATFFVFRV